MNANLPFQAAVGLLSVVLFVFCDYTITRWAESTGTSGLWTWRLFVPLVAAPLGVVSFGLVGARMGLAAVSAYINTGIVVGGVLAGVLIRGDHLSSVQKLGLALGLVAMVLINIGKPQ